MRQPIRRLLAGQPTITSLLRYAENESGGNVISPHLHNIGLRIAVYAVLATVHTSTNCNYVVISVALKCHNRVIIYLKYITTVIQFIVCLPVIYQIGSLIYMITMLRGSQGLTVTSDVHTICHFIKPQHALLYYKVLC